MSTKITTSNGGKKPYAHLLPFIALVLFGIIALVGVAAADSGYLGTPPETKLQGVVNGGVDVLNTSADPWHSSSSGTERNVMQETWGNMSLNDSSSADPMFARLYVVVYGGSMSANYTGNVSVKLYNDTSSDQLVDGQPLNLPYNRYTGTTYNLTFNENTLPLVNLSRTTSDYLLVFNVKDNVMNTDNLNVQVNTCNLTGTFDARVKSVHLAYGWNVTSNSPGETKYWVNEGSDPMNTPLNEYNTTYFDDTGVGELDQFNATLWMGFNFNVSQGDGYYTWNSVSLNGVNGPKPQLQSSGKYAGLDKLEWNKSTTGMSMDDDSNAFGYSRGLSSYYKALVDVLAVKA